MLGEDALGREPDFPLLHLALMLLQLRLVGRGGWLGVPGGV
ncbi:hypothetical protein [Amycolatopsis australiensis]|nr:hypothetical protein [Amycolatopsis australiensis]